MSSNARRAVCVAASLAAAFAVLAAAAAAGEAPGGGLGKPFETQGFSTPESVAAAPGGGWFVSNINGQPAAKDSNGFISKLAADGSVAKLRFVESTREHPLHAPKGLAVHKGTLYATDIDRLVGYSAEDGSFVEEFDLPGAKFANDVAASAEGALYVTDSQADRIYRAKAGSALKEKPVVLAEGGHLAGPNGVAVAPDGSLRVCTTRTGKILKVSAGGEVSVLHETGKTALDGLGFDSRGDIVVSSFSAGEVYRVDKAGKVEVLAAGLGSAADICVDAAAGLVVVPRFQQNAVKAVPLR